MQQNLRHLQRSMETHDLQDLRVRLDKAILAQHDRIRGGPNRRLAEGEGSGHAPLLTTEARGHGPHPIRHGSPLAFAAANDSSRTALAALFPILPASDTVSLTQHQRCDVAHARQHELIMFALTPYERCLVREAGSPLATRWLSIPPTSVSKALSNHEVSGGLQYRSFFQPKPHLTCPACQKFFHHGHQDTCDKGMTRRDQRHRDIQRVIASALRTVKGASVALEPLMGSANERNDIKIRSCPPATPDNLDVDTTVHSLSVIKLPPGRILSSATFRSIPSTLPIPVDSLAKQSQRELDDLVDGWARSSSTKRMRFLATLI